MRDKSLKLILVDLGKTSKPIRSHLNGLIAIDNSFLMPSQPQRSYQGVSGQSLGYSEVRFEVKVTGTGLYLFKRAKLNGHCHHDNF